MKNPSTLTILKLLTGCVNKPVTKSFSIKVLGRELVKTLECYCPVLILFSSQLLQTIHEYVFANGSPEKLKYELTRATKQMETFQEEYLEILLLSLEGARMIVIENKLVAPKEFDKYMIAKQFKVRKKVNIHQNRRKETLEDKTGRMDRTDGEVTVLN